MTTTTVPLNQPQPKSAVKQKITDRIKSFEDACKELGYSPEASVTLNMEQPAIDRHQKGIVSFTQLCIIAQALNEGWAPDWSDEDQRKWYPWFEYDKASGFGFSFADCDDWDSDASVGSRLCFRTEELADYAGRQFQGLYNDLLAL